MRERGGLCGDFLVALARLGATGTLGIHHGRIGTVGGGVVAGLLGGNDIALALKVGIPLIVEQGGHGIALDRLALEQDAGHEVHLLAAGGDDLHRALVGLAHDALDLGVDAARRLLGVVLMVGVIATQEHLVLCLAEHLRTELIAHA